MVLVTDGVVVYRQRAANTDWLQMRYDQPLDHLSGGADDAIRPRCPFRKSCASIFEPSNHVELGALS